MGDLTGAFIICAKATSETAQYWCRICNKTPLRVSREGLSQIERGGTPVCNACWFAAAKYLLKRDSACKAEVVVNPEANNDLERAGISIADVVGHRPRPGEPSDVKCPHCNMVHRVPEGVRFACVCGYELMLARA